MFRKRFLCSPDPQDVVLSTAVMPVVAILRGKTLSKSVTLELPQAVQLTALRRTIASKCQHDADFKKVLFDIDVAQKTPKYDLDIWVALRGYGFTTSEAKRMLARPRCRPLAARILEPKHNKSRILFVNSSNPQLLIDLVADDLKPPMSILELVGDNRNRLFRDGTPVLDPLYGYAGFRRLTAALEAMRPFTPSFASDDFIRRTAQLSFAMSSCNSTPEKAIAALNEYLGRLIRDTPTLNSALCIRRSRPKGRNTYSRFVERETETRENNLVVCSYDSKLPLALFLHRGGHIWTADAETEMLDRCTQFAKSEWALNPAFDGCRKVPFLAAIASDDIIQLYAVLYLPECETSLRRVAPPFALVSQRDSRFSGAARLASALKIFVEEVAQIGYWAAQQSAPRHSLMESVINRAALTKHQLIKQIPFPDLTRFNCKPCLFRSSSSSSSRRSTVVAGMIEIQYEPSDSAADVMCGRDEDVARWQGQGSLGNVFFASSHDVAVPLVVKFTPETYGFEPHSLLAKKELAPAILYHAKLEGGRADVILMERIRGKQLARLIWQFLEKFPQSSLRDVEDAFRVYTDKISATVKLLHKNGFVHGDIRGPNVLVLDPNEDSVLGPGTWSHPLGVNQLCSVSDAAIDNALKLTSAAADAVKVYLLDFDWAGREGQACFGSILNTVAGFPSDACMGGKIKKTHDLYMLQNICRAPFEAFRSIRRQL